MEQKKVTDTYKNIEKLISANRVNKAIKEIRQLSTDRQTMFVNDELSQIEEIYKYMFHYLLEGVQDDSREGILSEIKERLYSLNDKIKREIDKKESTDYYYEILRINSYRQEQVNDILNRYGNIVSELSLAEAAGLESGELRKSKEETLKLLFNVLFTSFKEDANYKDLSNYLQSGYADKAVIMQSLSALTLSLLKFYDRSKVILLLDIYETTRDIPAAARSLTALIFTLLYYKDRILNDTKLKARLSLLTTENISFRREVWRAIRAIIGTIDTKRIADKMKDELIPELMKFKPDILKSLREGDLDMNSSSSEYNPDWEEMLENSGLSEKMRELSEMQSEGADLLMVTFANLKQFPFFSSASNWFLPFDENHTMLKLDDTMKQFVTLISSSSANVCDSDIYSLAFAASQMPSAQRDMLSNQMRAQFEQMNEEIKSRLNEDTSPMFTDEVTKVVRDLYRFFKLFRKREGLKNPFDRPLDFMNIPFVKDLMSYDEKLRPIAEFYFKRGFYAESLPIIDVMLQFTPNDVMLWEQKGFSLQNLGSLSGALEAYNRAALLRTPGLWLTKKLAFINHKLGNYETAADYYRKALDLDSENLNLIMNLGNSLLDMGDLSGALSEFYHANYNSPENPKVMRAIGWIELLNGNIKKSLEYFKKVIKSDAKNSDYLNAGHASLLMGNHKEAVNYYRLASRENKEDFETAFLTDISVLSKVGFNKEIALVILDNL